MTSTKHAAVPPQATETSSGVGAFMLTLCRLETPVSIRPSQNPQLARFKFFMSRSRHADGNQHLYLHMGYFSTLSEAQKCVQIMRARYPQAIATQVPPRLSTPAGASSSSDSAARVEPPVLNGIPPAEASVLSDTQVLQILEARRVDLSELGKDLVDRPEISLLRPDDTNTRRALKESVVQGTPVSFVIQLCRSGDPINLGTVPSLDIFRAYTLYLAQGTHQGRSWHALHLGFFRDAVSAKQVAYYAHARFASAAVVPIDEREQMRASQNPIALTLLAKPAESSLDDVLAADQAAAAAAAAAAAKSKHAPRSEPASPPIPPSATQNRSTAAPKQRRKDGLEQTLELLAASELWNETDSDSLSETGVRHLKIEVQKGKSRGS